MLLDRAICFLRPLHLTKLKKEISSLFDELQSGGIRQFNCDGSSFLRFSTANWKYPGGSDQLSSSFFGYRSLSSTTSAGAIPTLPRNALRLSRSPSLTFSMLN